MKTTTLNINVSYQSPNTPEDQNSYGITVGDNSTGNTLFLYHGPVLLTVQTLTYQAIGQAIMAALHTEHRRTIDGRFK